ISYSHPDTPCLSIAAEIMTNRVLHKRIREQGGAYGSGAVNNVLLGYFYFYSYRDPNWQSTLTAFDESIQKVASGDFGDVEIEEAKLGIFQEVDSPVAPSNRADVTYYRQKGGRTPEMRQLYRERLLDATKEQIRCAVQSHLLPNMEREKTVTFAGKEFFEKEKCDLPLLSL
ncbi:MAG: insulinase family protein, partial [Chlamydiae bacterium]|nr:insulinase family protein [Chlamydiota bacterium]